MIDSCFSVGDVVLINTDGVDKGRLATITYVSEQNDSGDPKYNYYGIKLNDCTDQRELGYSQYELLPVRMKPPTEGGGDGNQ